MDKVKFANVQNALFLLLTFSIYSCSSIFSKLASLSSVFSFDYLLCLGVIVLALFVYAILWQKVLSIIPLNKAFLCKSVTIVMIMAASALFFKETITTNNIIGSVFIILGLVVLAWKK